MVKIATRGEVTYERGLWSVVMRTSGEDFLLLRDAVYSVAAQSYERKEIVLTYQRTDKFSRAHHDEFSENLRKLIEALEGLLPITLLEVDPDEDRTYPLKIAKAQASGEFLSFLDYDDIFYPYMGQVLIDRMSETGSNFAYGNSIVVMQDVCDTDAGSFTYTDSKFKLYGEEFGFLKLLVDNYIPINTYVLRVAEFSDVDFDLSIELAEDWDYLHSLVRTGRLNPSYLDIDVSEYRKRNNQTQTHNPALERTWNDSRERIFKKIAATDFVIPGEEINDFRMKWIEQQEQLSHVGGELHRLTERNRLNEEHLRELQAFVEKPAIRYPRALVSRVKRLLGQLRLSS